MPSLEAPVVRLHEVRVGPGLNVQRLLGRWLYRRGGGGGYVGGRAADLLIGGGIDD